MANILEKIVLHRVARDEYDKVMAIRENVYDGHDYLPARFYQIIDSTNSKAFAAVLDGKFIAFTIAYIVDDEKTWIARANRVAKDYEGQGVMKWLMTKVEEVVIATTSVLYHASSYLRDPTQNIHIPYKDKSYQVADKEFKTFVMNATELKIQSGQIAAASVQILHEKEIEALFGSDVLLNSLFGEECVVVFWIPFQPIKSNITYMIRESSLVTGSDIDDVDRILITFGTYFEGDFGLNINIDVYGNMKKIEDRLPAHIVCHLQQNLNPKSSEVEVRIMFNKQFDGEVIIKMMEQLKFTSRQANLIQLGCFCFQRKLR